MKTDKEEFNLSEKEINEIDKSDIAVENGYYSREDVKEFIKQEAYLITEIDAGLITFEEFWDKRKKLIGEKLK